MRPSALNTHGSEKRKEYTTLTQPTPTHLKDSKNWLDWKESFQRLSLHMPLLKP